MASQGMPSLPCFDPTSDPTSLLVRWERWLRRFEGAMVGFGITDFKRQKALLLHFGGEALQDIFETLDTDNQQQRTVDSQQTDPPSQSQLDEREYTAAKCALTNYFTPKKNILYESIVFRRTTQQADESVDQYCTRLRQIATKCEFGNLDRELKTQIIEGCNSDQLRRKALERDMSLTDLLELARSLSLSASRAAEVRRERSGSASVNKVFTRHERTPNRRQTFKTSQSRHLSNNAKQCFYCGGEYPHQNECPARGQKCRNCGILDHFAKVCKSRKQAHNSKSVRGQVSELTTSNAAGDTEEYGRDCEYTFGIKQVKGKRPRVSMTLEDTDISMLVDTGSTVNVITDTCYQRLTKHPTLDQSNKVRVYAYGSKTPLKVRGTFETELTFRDNTAQTTFYVVYGDSDNLLSCDTSESLGIVKLTYAVTADDMSSSYADLFNGLGKLKDVKCKLHIDETVKPVVQPHRRIPFHVRKQTEKELQRLLDLDIIERVGGEPTPWVSPILIVKKPKSPNQIRICVDMRAPNKAIQRERHLTPTIDEIIAKVNGARHFAKLDLNAGYHQIELAEESRYVTVFSTHVGLFRYKRLNFGVNSAAEVFQQMIQTTLSGLDGVLNISDDILVYGRTPEELNDRLEQCLKRLQDHHLTLNKNKCEFRKERMEFFGHVLSAEGVSPDPKKVQAIINASNPSNVQEVRSLLGLINYCGRFIPDLATLSAPLRNLTREEVEWQWTGDHQKAMTNVKQCLAAGCTNAFYDPDKNTQLLVDASPVGIGAVLAQKSRDGEPSVVALASRSLTPVEQRYSQIEREALAITWGIQHFHLYLYGNTFEAVTDHKPLVTIFNNAHSKPPTRIERWILKIQEYDFTVVYEPGKSNPADYLSRHPLPTTERTSREEKAAEQHINFVSVNAVPKSMKLSEIQDATKQDVALSLCMQALRSRNWKEVIETTSSSDVARCLQSFYNVRDQLSIAPSDDFVLRGNCIVIPQSLCDRVIEIAHEGHQGVVKTKQLLREKVWFPGIDRIVERKISQCLPCQATTVGPSPRAPLQMSDLPNGPWEEVSVDFADLPSGDHLLVIIDDYSRYPVVEVVSSTSGKATIPKLDKVFSLFGVPQIVKSDNGPPFNGDEFKQFAEYLGFTHRKITPRWPRANGEVERFMRTLKKVLRTAHAESKSWRQELHRFLRNYRATPHTTTAQPPATIMFSRPMRTRLPEISREGSDSELRERDKAKKNTMKADAERHMSFRRVPLCIGDTVLVKREGYVTKTMTPYELEPLVVTDVKGSMVTASRGSQKITRNTSFFKALKEYLPAEPVFVETEQEQIEQFSAPDDLSDDNEQTNPTTPNVERYSSRTRNPPAYLKDYVTKVKVKK
eukprot:XP_003723494.1 PREDICTED: uncharacterized protein K02A2.6-like [Strongylocentrotus purpuratus]